MKILIDMCLTPGWTRLLHEAGIEGRHWSEVGRADAPDTEIMQFAAENEYVALTHDLDFSAILAATRGGKPSVVQIRAKDVSPAVIGTRVIASLRQTEKELEAGALLTIDTDRMRLRLLPL